MLSISVSSNSVLSTYVKRKNILPRSKTSLSSISAVTVSFSSCSLNLFFSEKYFQEIHDSALSRDCDCAETVKLDDDVEKLKFIADLSFATQVMTRPS